MPVEEEFLYVSIPYGKGKDIINKEALYGYNRINSLWER